MKINIPVYVRNVLDTLYLNGFEGRLVGGCVRDSVMGQTPHDYDICTNALPEQMKKCFENFRIIPTGEKHGTITVMSDSNPIEITTYRIDGEYTDNRRPDSVEFTSEISYDLSRRDFTVNAMAYDSKTGIIDFYGGKEDIKNKIIRCVGEPDKRFCEDGLRILRALRFCAVLGFSADEKTAQSIHKNKLLLKNIAFERIFEELKKLLCGRDAGRICMEYSDVLCVIIPELEKCIGFNQHSKYHCYDVYEHMVKSMETVPAEPVVRLAAFLHDIGKPLCFSIDEKGGHFYGHNKIGASVVHDILTRLRADKKTVNTVSEIVYMHDNPINPTEKSVRRIMSKYDESFINNLIEVKCGDRRAHAKEYSDCDDYASQLRNIIEIIKEKECCFSLKQLEVNGTDIINMGIKPGKRVGEILKQLLDEVIDGKLVNERAVLLNRINEFSDKR